MNNYGIDHAVLQMKQMNYMHKMGEFMMYKKYKADFLKFKVYSTLK